MTKKAKIITGIIICTLAALVIMAVILSVKEKPAGNDNESGTYLQDISQEPAPDPETIPETIPETDPPEPVDYLSAEEDDFRLFEEMFFELITKYSAAPSYDARTADPLDVYWLLVRETGGMMGLRDLNEMDPGTDPLGKFTETVSDGDNSWDWYGGWWSVSVGELESAASDILGYDSELPDEVYTRYGKKRLLAYRYDGNYYIGMQYGIDGFDYTPTIKVNEYEKLTDGKYRISCIWSHQYEGTYEYSIIAGLREKNGERFWTIYSYDVVSE